MCKGPEAGIAYMLHELMEDQCGWSSLGMAWRRATAAGRQLQSANGDASGNSHMEGGGGQTDLGGGIDRPC